jgi:ABC-type sugar transport system ATPase subunit
MDRVGQVAEILAISTSSHEARPALRRAAAAGPRPGPIKQPKVLLLDEPLSASTPGCAWRCTEILRLPEDSATIIYVTHDSKAMTMSSRLAVMDGKTVQIDRPKDLHASRNQTVATFIGTRPDIPALWSLRKAGRLAF